MTAPVGRLTRRPEFLRVAERGRRAALPGMVVQALRRPASDRTGDGDRPVEARPVGAGPVDAGVGDPAGIRLGLTASRKVGGAVERNRARRRLRALARQVLPRHGAPGHDYVLVARRETVLRSWPLLVQDLEAALRRLGHWRGEENSAR